MLAINGGPKVRTDPFPSRRLFGPDEKEAAIELFDEAIESGSAFGYNGPREEAYEQAFVEYMGGGYADAVNSGTSAVLVALGALNLDCCSEVIVPPISDHGGVMPVVMLNCVPIPADAHPGSFNMGPEQIEAVLTERTRAIMVAHIAGEPVDMDPIMEIAAARDIPVVEDCAQAHGARYKGRLAGTIGTIAAFSTMSGKHHATGAQGGVVYTRDEDLFWEAKRFADRGKPFNSDESTNVRLGLNLNSNELSAAIGLVQLEKLPGIVASRRNVVEQIVEGIAEAQAVSLGWQVPETEASYWFLRMHLDASKLTVDKGTFVEALAAEGIPSGAYYRAIPAHAKWFRERITYGTTGYPWTSPEYGGDPGQQFELPNALAADESSFRITVFESWGQQEARDIAEALLKVERAYLAG